MKVTAPLDNQSELIDFWIIIDKILKYERQNPTQVQAILNRTRGLLDLKQEEMQQPNPEIAEASSERDGQSQRCLPKLHALKVHPS